eukprot:358232-Chlamydomonas_euryale.AAC.1
MPAPPQNGAPAACKRVQQHKVNQTAAADGAAHAVTITACTSAAASGFRRAVLQARVIRNSDAPVGITALFVLHQTAHHQPYQVELSGGAKRGAAAAATAVFMQAAADALRGMPCSLCGQA